MVLRSSHELFSFLSRLVSRESQIIIAMSSYVKSMERACVQDLVALKRNYEL